MMEQYQVLFVCLGNICRSPTAEGAMRQLLAAEAPDLAVRVESAGMGNWHAGEPPDARSRRAARARGIDLEGLRARQVQRADFMRFDLILAMDRENLAALEKLRPSGARARCALFLEYAGIAPARGVAEVPDPYLHEDERFDEVLDLIEAGTHALLERLRREGVAQR